MNFVVGLTGGIATGKSTAAQHFANLGIDVIDADAIARDLMLPASPAYHASCVHFGDAVLTGGQLDRRKLRQQLFNDPEAKTWLEALLHPKIREIAKQACVTSTSPYCVYMAPLLCENGLPDFVSRLLVTDCSENEQIRRLVARDHISTHFAMSMLKQQASRQQHIAAADDVLDTDQSPQLIEKSVKTLHQYYLSIIYSTP